MKVEYVGFNGLRCIAEYKTDKKYHLGYLEIRNADTQKVICQPLISKNDAQSFFNNLPYSGQPK